MEKQHEIIARQQSQLCKNMFAYGQILEENIEKCESSCFIVMVKLWEKHALFKTSFNHVTITINHTLLHCLFNYLSFQLNYILCEDRAMSPVLKVIAPVPIE